MKYKACGPLSMDANTDHTGIVKVDALIIGSGLAGLWAAYHAKQNGVNRIAVVDKGSIGESSQSRMSAGATMYLTDPGDFQKWRQEFIIQQQGLSRLDLIEPMLKESAELLKEQKRWGLWYEKLPWGSPELSVGGVQHLKMHVLPRYKNLGGGAALVNVIKDQVIDSNVSFYSKTMITELLKEKGRISGATGMNRRTGEPIQFKTSVIVLAAGDCGFGNTGCIGQATGDAYALAFNIGARVTNMEFWGTNTGSKTYSFESIADTAANFGCYFTNSKKKRFMSKYSQKADRAEPYVVAQSMANEQAKELANEPNPENQRFRFHMNKLLWKLGYKLILKRKMNGFVSEMFSVLKEQKIDPFKEPMEWEPVLRTIRGGIVTDIHGATDIPGLYAAGTAQAMDPVGLNGVSTLRAIWSGARAGKGLAEYLQCETRKISLRKTDNHSSHPAPRKERELTDPTRSIRPSPFSSVQQAVEKMQSILFPRGVSIRKTTPDLKNALMEIERLMSDSESIVRNTPHEEVHFAELRNMLLVAQLYLLASLERKESRGEHYYADYPRTDNLKWCTWICLEKDRHKIKLTKTRL